jgi:hypothetical protein
MGPVVGDVEVGDVGDVGDVGEGGVEVGGALVAEVVGLVVADDSVSDWGTPPSRRRRSITATWVAWTALSCPVIDVDAPPIAVASNPNEVVLPSNANSAFSSFMGTRVGTKGMRGAPSSSCTPHPDSAVTDPAASATNRDRRDQRLGIRSFAGMGSMMADWGRRPPRATRRARWRHSRRAGSGGDR